MAVNGRKPLQQDDKLPLPISLPIINGNRSSWHGSENLPYGTGILRSPPPMAHPLNGGILRQQNLVFLLNFLDYVYKYTVII